MVSIGVTIYRAIFQLQFTSTAPVFTRQNTFEKKKAIGEMLIEQIIELELRGPAPCSRTCTLTTGYFHDKTKILKANFQVD